MKIRGITPTVDIAGQSVQFVLRPRDALTWLALGQLDLAQARRWLSCCPEALLWSLANGNDAESVSGSDLIRLIVNARTSIGHASATVTLVDSLHRKRLQRALRRFNASDDLHQIRGVLKELIVNVCNSKLAIVDRWLDEKMGGHELWRELGTAAELSNEAVCVNLSAVCDDAGFEERLRLEKMASMKQLAYGASHEINNPLANIASRAQMLLLDEKDPKRRLRLAKINEQAFRAHEMIADMMLFAHPPEPEFVMVDPRDLVATVIEEIRPRANDQNTEIRLQFEDVDAIRADETHMAVAIKAILQNGLESLQQSGAICVKVCQNDAKGQPVLEIVVEDSGPGISPDSIRHLFDPFYSGREAGRGLGFGLSKAWRIAELHGGEIFAESPADGGARFCLRIPYRDAA